VTPLQSSARKAAAFASKLDFRLLGIASEHATEAERDANLSRAFAQFVGLLPHMRELKRLRPDLYAKAEADAATAREIEGRAA
jgi:hypothetical protein